MAVIRLWYDDPEWISITEDLTPRGAKTVTKISSSSFRIVGCDATTYFTVGRRVRMRLGASPPYQEAHVLSSSFGAGDTTVTIVGVNVPATFQPDGADVYFARSIDAGAFVAHPGVGDIRQVAGVPSVAAINGWLECNGQELDATTYAALAAICNSTGGFGTGYYDNHPTLPAPAAGNFLIPDMRGRSPVGFFAGGDADGYFDFTVGGGGDNADTWFGEKDHVLALAEMPAHDHGVAGDHGHDLKMSDNFELAPKERVLDNIVREAGVETVTSLAIANAGDHTHTSEGSDTKHENTQLGMIMGFVIYSGVIT